MTLPYFLTILSAPILIAKSRKKNTQLEKKENANASTEDYITCREGGEEGSIFKTGMKSLS